MQSNIMVKRIIKWILHWEKKQKWCKKDFFKIMNNSVFGKTIRNVRKHRDIKLATTDKRRNQLVSETNYHTNKDYYKDW